MTVQHDSNCVKLEKLMNKFERWWKSISSECSGWLSTVDSDKMCGVKDHINRLCKPRNSNNKTAFEMCNNNGQKQFKKVKGPRENILF
jgi:hypothetical protein